MRVYCRAAAFLFCISALLVHSIGCDPGTSSPEVSEVDLVDTPEEQPPKEIRHMTFEEMEKLHRYLCIDRWNNNGDMALRWGTNYREAAESLRIPVSHLKAADDYIHYVRIEARSERLRDRFSNHNTVEPAHYHPVLATAYCGNYTFHGIIQLEGTRGDPSLQERAKIVAHQLTQELPEWISGFKLNRVIYVDKEIEVSGDVDIAFLWRRGEEIRVMKPSTGTYGKKRPEDNVKWHTPSWNNGNHLPQIDIGNIAQQTSNK